MTSSFYPYSSGDLLAFRTAAVDCPVGEAGVENCPGPDTGAGDGGYTYGDLGKIIGFPEVHADGEIWVAGALGSARGHRHERVGASRDAGHGALTT